MKTHCKRGHEFTEANTYVSRIGRQCKKCKNMADRKYKAGEKLFCKVGHPMTTDNAYIHPNGYARCKTCKNEANRNSRRTVFKRKARAKRAKAELSGVIAGLVKHGRGYAGWGQWQ